MLVEMNVTNFLSIRDTQTLSLVKGKGSELSATNYFKTKAANDFELLRSAVIYGPNASGKTNFILALNSMKHIVLTSATNKQRGDLLSITPFRLSADTREAPSEFEVIFIVEGVRYQYGFSATSEQIHEEWLIAYPKGRAQRWFSRVWEADKKQFVWELGNSLTGEKQLWQKSTRENALYLSTAVQLNSMQLQPVFDWFKRTLRISSPEGWDPSFSASLCEEGHKSKVLELLHAADIDLDDIVIETKKLSSDDLPFEVPEELKNLIAQIDDKKTRKIRTVRKDSEGKRIIFDFDVESDGTQKLFAVVGPWIDVLENGYVLFVDELHNSLHPKLVQFLVELFHNSETNPKNAQLVFTTHETSILNQDVFRRDQIWFCEKNKSHATDLYPLTDFSPRKGRENLEMTYLSGRYGALPFVKNVHFTH